MLCNYDIFLVIFVGSNLKLQTTVAVMKVGQLSVYAPAKTLTNIPFPTKGYMFYVKFRFVFLSHAPSLYLCT